ncbi:MAG: hypothetical protein H0Z33_01690 [Bacillaceae bacterium]|nr:hypothetical protein [Bacillaceae bacterium]
MVDKATMQPLTTRELVDITSLLTTEDLLTKKYAQAASQLTEQKLQQFCLEMAERHRRNFNELFQSLNQHYPDPLK